jgi:hypothetical protein
MLVAKQPFLSAVPHTHGIRHGVASAVFQSSNCVFARGCVNRHSAIHGSAPAGMTFQR